MGRLGCLAWPINPLLPLFQNWLHPRSARGFAPLEQGPETPTQPNEVECPQPSQSVKPLHSSKIANRQYLSRHTERMWLLSTVRGYLCLGLLVGKVLLIVLGRGIAPCFRLTKEGICATSRKERYLQWCTIWNMHTQ